MRKIKQTKSKEIKSFNVDGEVYRWLIEKIKESKSDISISELVNDYLGWLYHQVRTILDYYERENIIVDVPWIINKIISSMKFVPPNVTVLYSDPDMKKWMEDEAASTALEYLEQYQREQKMRIENAWEKRRIQTKEDFKDRMKSGKKTPPKRSRKIL